MEGKQFYFDKRTRRPPQDPLNAMISFGNTLLYQRIANEINRTSLDIRIGIVHAAGNRSESLNLDFHVWLNGFEDTEKSVRGTVDFIVRHPLIPSDVTVYGFIIDSTTGELTRIV